MAGQLEGKSALITGAASGQGRAAALRFAAEGALLTLADADAEGLKETAAQITAGGPPVLRTGDLLSEAVNEQMVAAAVEQHGRLDVLYNAAGLTRFASIHEMPLDDWRFVMEHEMTMVYLGCRYGIQAMLVSGGGAIVNISSVSGYAHGTRRHAAHAAAKAGVAGLTKQVAVEYGPQGIRCNAIAPGFIVYQPGQRRITSQTKPFPPDGVPLGRHVAPEDTAACALFLASDDASMITGQTIVVDGGNSIS